MDHPLVPTPSRPRFAPTLRAGIAYALILAILFWRLFTGAVLNPAAIAGSVTPFQTTHLDLVLNSNRLQGDVWSQFIPWQFEQYQRGSVPLWNPYVYCGFPVFANGQSEFLNPTHWIYYFLNPDLARGPMAALRLWLSAMAMFIFLRRFRLSPMAAFLGGAVWMLSAFNIRWLLWPHTDSSLVIPVLLLALDAFLEWPTARRWALVALAGTLLALSGHPGTQMLVAFIAILFVLVHLAFQRAAGHLWSALVRRLFACAAAALAAAAAAAVALLPLANEILGSYELHHGDRSMPPLPLQDLWLFLTPNILGWPRGNHDFTQSGLDYNEAACFFGLIALALALPAIVAWFPPFRPKEPGISDLESGILKEPKHPAPGSRLGIFQIPNPKSQIPDSSLPILNPQSSITNSSILPAFATLLLLLSTLLAFGALSYLPIFHDSTLGRATSLTRLFMGVHFAGAILAALGADLFARSRRFRLAALASLLILTASACTYTLVSHPEQLQFFRSLNTQPNAVIWLDSSFRTFGGLCLAILACVVFVAIVWLGRRAQLMGTSALCILTFFVVADLLWVACDFNPISPRELVTFPLPPILRQTIALAGEGRIIATGSILAPNQSTSYRFRDPRGYDLPKPLRLGQVFDALQLSPLYIAIVPHERLAPVMEPVLAAWLDRCAVGYLVTGIQTNQLTIAPVATGSANSHEAPWPLALQSPQCSIYANPNAYPRAFIPALARTGTSLQAMDALLDPTADLRQTTILESAQPDLMTPLPSWSSGSVRITTDHDQEVVLDANTLTGGVVVLHDAMAPGWSVTVDDASAPPLTANYLFRAVQVPPGHHTIRWSYLPPGFLPGAILSSFTLLLLLALLLRPIRN